MYSSKLSCSGYHNLYFFKNTWNFSQFSLRKWSLLGGYFQCRLLDPDSHSTDLASIRTKYFF